MTSLNKDDAKQGAPKSADWYFDFISPFAYLQFEQFERLQAKLQINPRPILLAGLLSHWEQKGPAEIAAKRVHTYRYCHFRAEQLGIPFKMPPAHPFNPLPALRLAIALGGGLDAVRSIFRHIWRDGNDISSPQGWHALCDRLQLADADALIARDEVKQQLRANTERAIEQGVFGVPCFVVDEELFWGEDATAMLEHHLQHPGWLHSPELQRISGLPVGVQRKL